jgi:hypothetical protein
MIVWFNALRWRPAWISMSALNGDLFFVYPGLPAFDIGGPTSKTPFQAQSGFRVAQLWTESLADWICFFQEKPLTPDLSNVISCYNYREMARLHYRTWTGTYVLDF